MDQDLRVEPDVATFESVLGEELAQLGQLREGVEVDATCSAYDNARASDLTGLAFSGGGIRSATFNLGVIQALARFGLLSRFDYLSTVSGGGYIGGWLSALLHRKAGAGGCVDQQAVERFQARLEPHPRRSGKNPPDTTVGFPPVEHMAVRYLRCYSNYLTPRLGLSGDMLAVISIFLRNFTLIQLGLISLLAAILLLAHGVAAGSAALVSGAVLSPLALAAAGGLLLSFIGVSVNRLTQAPAAFHNRRAEVERRLDDVPRPDDERRVARDRRRLEDRRLVIAARPGDERRGRHTVADINHAVSLRIILPSLASAGLFCVAIAQVSALRAQGAEVASLLVGIPALASAGYIAGWFLSYSKRSGAVVLSGHPADARWHRFAVFVSTVVTGGILGLLVFAALNLTLGGNAVPIDVWHATAFGPPLFLLGLLFCVSLHMGAVRRAITEHYREWLARLGGLILLCATVWTLIFGLVLYATPLVHWLAGGGLVALAVWAGGSGAGVWLARSPVTGSDEQRGSLWRDLLSRAAPWLFVGGLAVIVAYATQIVLLDFNLNGGYARPLAPDFGLAATSVLQQLNELHTLPVLAAFAVLALLFGLITWRFDINLFSLHALYCNRLARAYLGASRAGERSPNPFSGFDVDDDVPFHALDGQRPIHIVNTAINMTGGDDLAWQTRRAASFAVTPRWAGFETRSTQGHRLGAYRRTRDYAGGRNLGTWMAVSGAAASPNMGYHTSPAVAALMTAFNLRLGRWCGNPARAEVWDKTSPSNAVQPILAELTGSATAQADWVNLTDGGHFENLGVYELIRRRCRLILVTDVGCDPQHTFADLANLLRKCWTDLGVNIRFNDLDALRRKAADRNCEAHFAIARIEYKNTRRPGDREAADTGVLIYIKASMTGDEWPDIRQYADNAKGFPHETTTDQFFDENQFEAYRHLGYKVLAKLHGRIAERIEAKYNNCESPSPERLEPKDLTTQALIELLMPAAPTAARATQCPLMP
ncbi:MAG: patatin-like phospholipase family protein [Gammaproteobacteria bacterium]